MTTLIEKVTNIVTISDPAKNFYYLPIYFFPFFVEGYTSLILQGVCNKDKKFIDIFVGFPGSVHDSRVFRNSPVKDKLLQLPIGYFNYFIFKLLIYVTWLINYLILYFIGYHLLGDSAYPCSRQLLVPYRDNGHLTHAKNHFNTALSGERIDIEHSFGILKQRFRQLYYCKLRDLKTLCHFIRACTVLHNLSRSEEEIIFQNEEVIVDQPGVIPFNDVNLVENGNLYRDAICHELFE